MYAVRRRGVYKCVLREGGGVMFVHTQKNYTVTKNEKTTELSLT